MYKAIIIEDEYHAAKLLESMLNDIEPLVQVLDKCVDLPSGVRSIRMHKPDVVFLDIELPVYSGIQLLEFFDPKEIDFQIIFTTAFNEYALKAFEMCAIDYLMKPLQEHKLRGALEKLSSVTPHTAKELLPALKHNLLNGTQKKMVLPVASGFEIVNVEDICFFKAEGSYTHISVKDGTHHLVSKNLKHFEQLLEGTKNFLRVHRSVMVNVLFIKKIVRNVGHTILLNDKTELPVAEERVRDLLAILQEL
ncbi:LytTR family DNA-binding domain-containing protein [Pedobacter sp. KR3-3]|uniref:LytTR family DNA-binding domain-containing protein n=1 Tax=Pedobacter albus TaxID=3113905 RepID=A0ABU7I4C2_9SPHI|nr:LytTR family DNA-binding domain-containing protein [Pedobacter sp. KR3-3]MEE1944308.1 LytTR family DNA-binding domain-containing protein [Pedobacter sp. KR3-3]